MAHQDPDEVVTAAEYPSEMEAGFAQSLLNEHGIESRVVGGLTSGFRAEAPGKARVLVHARDLERARELLREDDEND